MERGTLSAWRAGEDMMKKLAIMTAVGALALASPAIAHHAEHLDDAFATRGACEVEKNQLSNDDDWLIDAFPDLFSSEGEVRSFLNRAFPCEINASDGKWHMVDDRLEVLNSDWFARRNH
jgi:hypothetical protein